MKLATAFATALMLLGNVVCVSAIWAAEPADSPEVADLSNKIGALRAERVATATMSVEANERSYAAGTNLITTLLFAHQQLVDARLAVATTPGERIQALDEHLRSLKRIEKNVAGLFEAGMRGGSADAYAIVKCERETAELALLEAKLKVARRAHEREKLRDERRNDNK